MATPEVGTEEGVAALSNVVWASGFGVPVWELGDSGLGFKASGLEFRFGGFGSRLGGLGFRVCPRKWVDVGRGVQGV